MFGLWQPDWGRAIPNSLLAHAPEAAGIPGQAHVGQTSLITVPHPGTAIGGAGGPGAASQHALFALFRPTGIVGGAFAIILGAVIIVAPFPHVSGHVEEVPGIGLALGYRMRMAFGVVLEPGMGFQFLRIIADNNTDWCCPRGRRIPTRLRWAAGILWRKNRTPKCLWHSRASVPLAATGHCRTAPRLTR